VGEQAAHSHCVCDSYVGQDVQHWVSRLHTHTVFVIVTCDRMYNSG